MATPDRWPPFQEQVAKAADQNVFNATVAIGSLVFAGTPHVDSRLMVTISLDVENVGGAADTLIVNLRNGGVTAQAGPATKIPAGERMSVSYTFMLDIANGVTYLLDFTAQTAALTTFTVHGTRSVATVLALPHLHS